MRTYDSGVRMPCKTVICSFRISLRRGRQGRVEKIIVARTREEAIKEAKRLSEKVKDLVWEGVNCSPEKISWQYKGRKRHLSYGIYDVDAQGGEGGIIIEAIRKLQIVCGGIDNGYQKECRLGRMYAEEDEC